MKKTKVIARKNQPSGLPLLSTVVLWLVLDKTQAAPWVWGAVGTLMLLLWIAAIMTIAQEQHVDIFKDNP